MTDGDLVSTSEAWQVALGNVSLPVAMEAFTLYTKADPSLTGGYFTPRALYPFIRQVRDRGERVVSVAAIEAPKRGGLPADWARMKQWFIDNPGKTGEDYEREVGSDG